MKQEIELIEARLLRWAERNSFNFLRVSIGAVYFLFGFLKFFPNHSPAEQLAVDTIKMLSFGLVSDAPALLSLAVLETGVGLCFLLGFRLRFAVYLAVGHMLGTFLPLFFFPEQAFTGSPISISLVGQYIIKNLILVSALFVLYAKSAVKRQAKIIMMAAGQEAKPPLLEEERLYDISGKIRQENVFSGYLLEKQKRL